jgi:protein-tyrosine kinase
MVKEMSQVYRALEKAEREKQQKVKEKSLLEKVEEEPTPPDQESSSKDLGKRTEKYRLASPEKDSISFVQPHSFAAEQFRKLRTHIFLKSPTPPHSILITSSLPGEGKTTVSVNLALSIAQDFRKKAILIDADLRRPSITLEKGENLKGLADYLQAKTPLSEILYPFESNNLWAIPSGSPVQQPAELIGSKRMEYLITSLREMGEETFIVIDSPPILATSEPTLLSKLVDAVILVVMADRAPKSSICKAVDSIDRQKILGVVFNQKGLKPSTRYYSGYYYHQHDKK